MKTLSVFLLVAGLGLAQEPTTVPEKPTEVVITVRADGETSRWNLSADDIHVLNLLAREGQGTFDERLISYLARIRKELSARDEFATPALKADDDAIAARRAAKQAKIDSSVGNVTKVAK
jgi:hypothetical protein